MAGAARFFMQGPGAMRPKRQERRPQPESAAPGRRGAAAKVVTVARPPRRRDPYGRHFAPSCRTAWAAGLAESSDLERHLLRFDALRRHREQRLPLLRAQGNLHDLLASTADGEGRSPVAAAMIAGDEGGT